jgi:hypothetical protein
MDYKIRFYIEGNIQIQASAELKFGERTKSTNCIVARKDSTANWMWC